MCQRYYQKSYEHGTAPGTATAVGVERIQITDVNNSTHTIEVSVRLRPAMRTAPTVVSYGSSGNSGKCDMNSAGDRTATITNASESAFEVAGADTGAGTGRLLEFSWTASAEL